MEKSRVARKPDWFPICFFYSSLYCINWRERTPCRIRMDPGSGDPSAVTAEVDRVMGEMTAMQEAHAKENEPLRSQPSSGGPVSVADQHKPRPAPNQEELKELDDS